MRTGHELISGRNGYEKWLPTLESSSREVFRMMLGTELGRGSPELGRARNSRRCWDWQAHLCGLLSVRCRQESATLIASAMLDLAPNNVADYACDAIGEVANMIAGNFKNKLEGRFRKCMLSVPTVISGADYNFRSLTDAGPLDLRFTFHGLPLEVTLEIHS